MAESYDDPLDGASERSFFLEKEDVVAMVNEISCLDEVSCAIQFDKLKKILDSYQEQPQLLGPHLEVILFPLNILLLDEVLKIRKVSQYQFHHVCKVIQLLCKVRGSKQCAKYLPHEVHQLEPCISYLREQSQHDFDTWEIRFVLLLWMGTLCLIPFDIVSLDSSIQGTCLVDCLIGTSKAFLSDSGPTREAAALCISCLLTRPDMQSTQLHTFIDWCLSELDNFSHESDICRTPFLYLGILESLHQIFKRGHRDRLYYFVDPVLAVVLKLCDVSTNTRERKFLCKLTQRLGMALLPNQEANWRYQRGRRTLALGGSGNSAFLQSVDVKPKYEVDSDDWEVPSVLESVVEVLLNFLANKDTIVRWSAAKGIGRVSMRLPKGFADVIVDSVFSMFDDPDDDCRWHGGCLALAELTRRGLLLPEKLNVAIPLVREAIHYDRLKGHHGVGAHVRDAAAYVCWSFSRAYDPQLLRPFVRELSASMLCSVLFDREVNCRRAAAAAFQESVGRQGHDNFPHGVEIIGIADYFAVGNRSTCFIDLAPQIASYDSFLAEYFVLHLNSMKVCHWDKEIRELSSKSLSKILLITSSSFCADELLVSILDNCLHSTLSVRHGSLLTIASAIQIYAAGGRSFPPAFLNKLESLVGNIEKKRLFRGRGGELVRQGMCLVLESMSCAAMEFNAKTQVAFVEFLNEQLRQPHDFVQDAARNALRRCLFHFFGKSDNPPSDRLQKLTILKYVDGLKIEQNVAATRGYAMAIGALPSRILCNPLSNLDLVLKTMAHFADPSTRIAGQYDAETCCASIRSVTEIVEKLHFLDTFGPDALKLCLSIFIRGCEDYNVDKRGDTGSWSRISSLRGLENSLRIIGQKLHEKCAVETPFGAGRSSLVNNLVIFPMWSLGGRTASHFEWIDTKALRSAEEGTVSIFVSSSWPISSRVAALNIELSLMDRIWAAILKQLSEKLDAVRSAAGSVLENLLHSDRFMPSTATELFLMSQLTAVSETENSLDWSRPEISFPFVCRCVESNVLMSSILNGLVISIGGLTESTARCATQALVDVCHKRNQDFIAAVGESLVQLLLASSKDERILLPLLKTLEILCRQNVFNSIDSSLRWEERLFDFLLCELRVASSIPKIMLSVDLITTMITLPGVDKQKSIELLANMLSHRYPRIRRYASENLYLILLGDDQGIPEQTMSLLMDTAWETLSREEYLSMKADICHSLGVCSFSTAGTAAPSVSRGVQDELDSYESLVRDAGY